MKGLTKLRIELEVDMAHKLTVLIIEDEKNICNFIETTVTNNGYKTVTAYTGADGLSLAASCCPDLILLDLGLPDIDGMEIIRTIRQSSNMPIIVISARTQENEKVNALDHGADDYITKPFGTPELLARIRTALRHTNTVAGSANANIYSVDGLVIDFEKRLVTVDGREVHLTQIEYKLICLLAKQPGKVLTYDYILKQIWGPFTDTNNQILRVNMAHIRRKLEANPAEPKYIFKEIGVGYRMKE